MTGARNEDPGSGRLGVLVPASLFVVVLASRLPFLGPGYGSDSDTWLVMSAARHLAETGEYLPSRAPGYPLFEFAHALLWRAGIRSPFACSLATAVFSGLATLVFYRLAADLMSRRRAAGLALVFAFTPGVYVASCEVVDYLWALPFLLLAFREANCGRLLRAGLLCGIAIGFRPTSGIFLLPLGVLAIHGAPPGRRLRAAATLVLPAVALAGVCFLPLIPHYAHYRPLDLSVWSARYLLFAVRLWEPLGFLALVAGTALAIQRLVSRSPFRPPAESTAALVASLVGILAVGLLFLRFPYEPGYLVPAVPLFLLAFGLLLDRRALTVVGVLMVASSAVTYSPSRGAWEPGGVFYFHSKRSEDLESARATLAAAKSLENGSVVLIRYTEFILRWEQGQVWSPGFGPEPSPVTQGGVRFLEQFNRAEVEGLIDEGSRVYFVPRVREVLPETWERDGRQYRIEPLPGVAQASGARA